jgi:hypothetical protein
LAAWTFESVGSGFRREYYQQGGQQGQEQVAGAEGLQPGQQLEQQQDEPVKPSEEGIALGLGIMSLWVLFALGIGACALAMEAEEEEKTPRKYDWIAGKLAAWGGWCAVWVGVKCLSLVWGSWWKPEGRIEPGKGIGAFALVGFVLANVFTVVAGGIVIFQRRSPVSAMAPTWIFNAIVG